MSTQDFPSGWDKTRVREILAHYGRQSEDEHFAEIEATTKKAFVVGEIRRTASENGGKPLGVVRFLAVTGIRTSEVIGMHWARWGDALREAGFAPNELRRAYSRDDLLKRYCELAHELGHLPVKDEVRMKHRSDPDFPGWDPFTRLGSRAERVRAVVEFCRTNTGYDDVLELCEECLDGEPVTRREPKDVSASAARLGHVYLAKSGHHYKIGKSNAVGRREYEIGLQMPEKVAMIHVITTDDPTGIEAYWHKRFEAKRKNGEWFDLSREDVAAFKRRRKFM